ncbi:hypothetical protein MM239_11250 [Belliella sp. DSM 111904]|uniref:Lipoprotein n=1 Tax=Belliella filtrata TaxID=2923435 RepID=A0ABS9V0Q0_9BACT|nr:hypothetical protein [Belliella filtrata]MCH7409971.1 hypothetical protein [Belliella filtrata]
MLKGLILIFILVISSSCSVFRSVRLVNKEMTSRTQIYFADHGSYLSIKADLLDSKIISRSSRVNFKIKVVSKVPNTKFESDELFVYVYETNSKGYSKIQIINNSFNSDLILKSRKSKFKVSALVNQSNIIQKGTIKKIGLKLPSIVIGDENIDFGIIDFDLK